MSAAVAVAVMENSFTAEVGVQENDRTFALGAGASVNPRLTVLWFGTRAEYNALEEIDPAICYCIEEGT